MQPDTTVMTPFQTLDDPELVEWAEEAWEFLSRFRWCRKVLRGHLAYGVGGVIGVFLFHIEPA